MATKKRVDNAHVYTMGLRDTALGEAIYVRIYRNDDEPMTWREIWEKFARAYPGWWACQWFPPAEALMDEANVYHLFVFDSEPRGMNIRRK